MIRPSISGAGASVALVADHPKTPEFQYDGSMAVPAGTEVIIYEL
jgi:hypothetical protein